MLHGVWRQPRHAFRQSCWPWNPVSTHASTGFSEHRQWLHVSHPEAPVIFSGIQPTGVPHLGNYLGALQPWARLQIEASPSTRLFYSIVDLHAITATQDADRLRRWKRETLATLLAVGLDPERSTIFYQSAVCSRGTTVVLVGKNPAEWMQVPEHTELMWILSCTASVGYLSRMTQWKVCYDGAETWIVDRSILTDWTSTGQARPIGWGCGVRLYERKSKTQTGTFFLSRATSCGYPAIWVHFLPPIPSQALSRSLFQRDSCSGRTGSSTAFGICKTMRWSIQCCSWWDLCETTNPLMYVKPLVIFVSRVQILNFASICKACHVAPRAASQDVEIPSQVTFTDPTQWWPGSHRWQNQACIDRFNSGSVVWPRTSAWCLEPSSYNVLSRWRRQDSGGARSSLQLYEHAAIQS